MTITKEERDRIRKYADHVDPWLPRLLDALEAAETRAEKSERQRDALRQYACRCPVDWTGPHLKPCPLDALEDVDCARWVSPGEYQRVVAGAAALREALSPALEWMTQVAQRTQLGNPDTVYAGTAASLDGSGRELGITVTTVRSIVAALATDVGAGWVSPEMYAEGLRSARADAARVADIERDQARADLELAQAGAAAMRIAIGAVLPVFTAWDDPADASAIAVLRGAADATDAGAKVLEELQTLRAEQPFTLLLDYSRDDAVVDGLTAELRALRGSYAEEHVALLKCKAEIDALRAAAAKAKAALETARSRSRGRDACRIYDDTIAALEAASNEKGEVGR